MLETLYNIIWKSRVLKRNKEQDSNFRDMLSLIPTQIQFLKQLSCEILPYMN